MASFTNTTADDEQSKGRGGEGGERKGQAMEEIEAHLSLMQMADR